MIFSYGLVIDGRSVFLEGTVIKKLDLPTYTAACKKVPGYQATGTHLTDAVAAYREGLVAWLRSNPDIRKELAGG